MCFMLCALYCIIIYHVRMFVCCWVVVGVDNYVYMIYCVVNAVIGCCCCISTTVFYACDVTRVLCDMICVGSTCTTQHTIIIRT